MRKMTIFGRKPWTNLLQKFRFLDFFLGLFCPKKENLKIFHFQAKTMKIFNFATYQKLPMLQSKIACLSYETLPNTFPLNTLSEKKKVQSVQFLTKIGLSPLKNSNFATIQKSTFCNLKSSFFYIEYCQTHFFDLLCRKRKTFRCSNFWLKPWVNAFEKFLFSTKKISNFLACNCFFPTQNNARHIPLNYFAQKDII